MGQRLLKYAFWNRRISNTFSSNDFFAIVPSIFIITIRFVALPALLIAFKAVWRVNSVILITDNLVVFGKPIVVAFGITDANMIFAASGDNGYQSN